MLLHGGVYGSVCTGGCARGRQGWQDCEAVAERMRMHGPRCTYMQCTVLWVLWVSCWGLQAVLLALTSGWPWPRQGHDHCANRWWSIRVCHAMHSKEWGSTGEVIWPACA
jgi:hypothetical protein